MEGRKAAVLSDLENRDDVITRRKGWIPLPSAIKKPPAVIGRGLFFGLPNGI